MNAILVMFLSAAVGCYFAACAVALRSFSRVKLLEVLQEKGKAHRYDRFVQRIDRLALMTGTLRTCLAMIVFAAALAQVEVSFPQLGLVARNALALGQAAVLVSVALVAIPAGWGTHHPERLLARTLPFLQLCLWLLSPLVAALHVFDPLVRKVFGNGKHDQEQNPLADDLMSVVEEHEDKVDESQKEMLEAVIELPSTTVGQIMTPRTDVLGLEISTPLEQIRAMLSDQAHSRIPVYRESLDQIVGVLYVKDLLRYVGSSEPFELKKVLREVLVVPESKPVRALLAEFKARKVHMAIVLDEYGGTAGLVTVEDIIEEIVGEISDEYEAAEEGPKIHRLDEHAAEVDARCHVDELNDALGLQLPENEDYDTVGGFVFSTLGHIPSAGEAFDFDNVTITVLQAERTKVKRVRVEKKQSDNGQDSALDTGK